MVFTAETSRDVVLMLSHRVRRGTQRKKLSAWRSRQGRFSKRAFATAACLRPQGQQRWPYLLSRLKERFRHGFTRDRHGFENKGIR
jgi:hypothetical protein